MACGVRAAGAPLHLIAATRRSISTLLTHNESPAGRRVAASVTAQSTVSASAFSSARDSDAQRGPSKGRLTDVTCGAATGAPPMKWPQGTLV